MTTATPAALVAAAPTLYRRGLVAMLEERWPELALTLTADATQLPELIVSHTFGLLVLDGHLANRNLLVLLAQLYRARPTQRLVVLADLRPTEPAAQQAQAGSRLLLPRHVPPPALAEALVPWLDAPGRDPFLARRPQTQTWLRLFSTRELQVLRLVVADQCNQEIADRLCLSPRTVESHRRTLLHKAGTRTLVGLAALAVREGWVA